MSSEAGRVGICVLNWNAGSSLVHCVRNLRNIEYPARPTLTIVDNHSTDDSIAALVAEYPDVDLIRNRENLGYSAGNNIGARRLMDLGCDYLVFVNPDVEMHAECLGRLIDTLCRDPGAGCVGGVPVSPTGKEGAVARNRPSVLATIIHYGPLHRIPFLDKLDAPHWLFADDIRDGDHVYAICGACMAFRSEAFRQINGLDEATFLYAEEFIIAERLAARGWKIACSTQARYTHIEAVSTGKMPYLRRLHFIRSEGYFLRQYFGWSAWSIFLLRMLRMLEFALYSCRWLITGRKSTRSGPRGLKVGTERLRESDSDSTFALRR